MRSIYVCDAEGGDRGWDPWTDGDDYDVKKRREYREHICKLTLSTLL